MSDQAKGWTARILHSPASVALIGGIVAVGCGLALMALGSASSTYTAVNSAALLIGLALAAVVQRKAPDLKWVLVGGPALLLVTALFGTEVEGIRRWLMIGPVQVQPAFLALPLMVIVYARNPEWHTGWFAMAAAVLALAIQPDRSMSSMLALALLVIWVQRPNRTAGVLAAVAIGGWTTTMLRGDPLSAVPFVENVLAEAVATGAPNAVIAIVGAFAIVAPAVARKPADRASQFALLAFAICWGSLLGWSIIAPYPTPLLGYGPSAIIGYFLSVVALRKPARALESS